VRGSATYACPIATCLFVKLRIVGSYFLLAPESFPSFLADNPIDHQGVAIEINVVRLQRPDRGVSERTEIAIYGPGVIGGISEALENLLKKSHSASLRGLLDSFRREPEPRLRPHDTVDVQGERERVELAGSAVQLVGYDPISGHRTKYAVIGPRGQIIAVYEAFCAFFTAAPVEPNLMIGSAMVLLLLLLPMGVL
jgi:hypothetical protein